MKTLLGQTLAEGRPIYMALRSVFGIGRYKALELCNTIGISPRLRVYQVSNSQVRAIANILAASADNNARAGNNASEEIRKPGASSTSTSFSVSTRVSTTQQNNERNRLSGSSNIRIRGSKDNVSNANASASADNATINSADGSKKLYGLELKRLIRDRINTLVAIKAYRGFRHVLHLPARGQRTKTNAHTVKRIKTI